ncbi:MAG: peptide chain release factor N(5)-glutamine methyltransferase [candidate division WOR-3 bacterium]
MLVSEAIQALELYLAGRAEPAREAYYIITELLADAGETSRLVTEIPDSMFRKAVRIAKRRARGEPIQYIFRRAYFMDMVLRVKKGIFIPRPETEVLALVAGELYPKDSEIRIWDIGTGTGCLAIYLARHYGKSTVIASDISGKALKIARENANSYGVSGRISFVKANGTKAARDTYHLVVSNPPYIRTEELKDLPRDVLMEPAEALCGGEDGAALSKEIILNHHLVPGGWVVLETSPFIAEAVLRFAREHGFQAEVLPDLSGFPRVIRAQWNG